MSSTHTAGKKPRVAVIVTEYRFNSHADVILGRLLGHYGYSPRVEVVSLYTDQVPDNDMSRKEARKKGVPIYPTIAEAITEPHIKDGIDGVIIIGEHGDYPVNEKKQKQYPRFRLLNEVLQTLSDLQRNVPVFSDKHLSYDFREAILLYERLKKQEIPFMGGSSIPFVEQVPSYDTGLLRQVKEILVVSFSVGIEAYGYHALEVLQMLAEQREAGETGVRSINARMGESVWEAADRQEWPEDLMLEALRTYPDVSLEKLREKEPAPVLFEIDYEDGTKGYVVQFLELVPQWGFAFRTVEGTTAAARCNSELERPFGHFATLTRHMEEFILTRKPPFPMERTLMTTGMIDLAMESLYLGKRLETPELSIHYGKGDGRDTCQAGREEGKDGR